MNKKGQGFMGRIIIFGIASIFGVGILHYFVVEYGIIGNLLPILTDYIQSSTITASVQAQIFSNYNKIKFFLRLMPYVLWFVLMLYWIVSAFRRETEESYVT